MTLRKMSILSAAALIAVTGMVQAAVTPPMHITIEYEYARDGEIVSRTVNGKVQCYAYDRRGQLTGIYDADGEAVEAYTYDAAGNILKKTINGKTTTFTYDAANQLVSKQDDAGTTSYEYDAAGRMIREGGKEYRYSYLDKITSVIENGETAATMDYFVGGQLASVTRGHEIERFIWDGLALVHRDGSDYLNEPAVGGGNPIASGGQVMFNDMLGSTVAVKGDASYSLTSMTAFGESSDSGAFFTGKPFIGEIGYAFLMRSYRPEHGKWQTADPIGYPDGWNNLAYVNNSPIGYFDFIGAWRTTGTSYDVFDWPLGWNTPTTDMALAGLSGYYFNATSSPLSSALVSYAEAGTDLFLPDYALTVPQLNAVEADSGFSAVVNYVKNKVNSSTTGTVTFSHESITTFLISPDLNTAIHGVTFYITGTITKGDNPWSGNLRISFSDPYNFVADAPDFKVRIWGRLSENNWISEFSVTGKWTVKFTE